MRELPTGTVTFLFTDIEGSTRLLHELGDGYADALAEHRRLLREAFACHGGVEVDTQGDAFFVAFARATDALSAADVPAFLARPPFSRHIVTRLTPFAMPSPVPRLRWRGVLAESRRHDDCSRGRRTTSWARARTYTTSGRTVSRT